MMPQSTHTPAAVASPLSPHSITCFSHIALPLVSPVHSVSKSVSDNWCKSQYLSGKEPFWSNTLSKKIPLLFSKYLPNAHCILEYFPWLPMAYLNITSPMFADPLTTAPSTQEGKLRLTPQLQTVSGQPRTSQPWPSLVLQNRHSLKSQVGPKQLTTRETICNPAGSPQIHVFFLPRLPPPDTLACALGSSVGFRRCSGHVSAREPSFFPMELKPYFCIHLARC